MNENITNQPPHAWSAAEARMSFFRKPITNKFPEQKAVSLFQVYDYVRNGWARLETSELRGIADHDEARNYKGTHFDYVTPSGTFSYCSDQSMIRHSGMICMDLDHLGDRVEELFQLLVDEPLFDTLLLFRSPSGQGLKWFVHIDLTRCDHRTWFMALRNYLMATYHLSEKQVDGACANVSRACYLSHDPEAFLRTDLIEHF